jgi:hypothetical protein
VPAARGIGDRLRDLSLRHQVGLAGYENELIARVLALLDEADARLERRILIALEETEHLALVERLQAIRDSLSAVNDEAYAAVGTYLPDELRKLAVLEAEWTAGAIEGALPFKLSFNRPSRQLLRAIVTELPFPSGTRTARELRTHLARTAGNRLDAVVSEIQQGLVQQDSYSDIVGAIRGSAKSGFTDGVLENVGRVQIEALARTAAGHVVESARDELWQENAKFISAVMWVSTLDRRTTQICQLRDGKTYTVKGHQPTVRNGVPTHRLPWLGGPGRAHWRCRSTSIPVLSDLEDFRRLGYDVDKLGDAERAAMGAPVPVDTGYEEWLRAQDEDTQAEVLGAASRAAEFRAGLGLEEAWAKRFVPSLVTPRPLSDLYPGAQP